jgi:PleD family two-component response regulator
MEESKMTKVAVLVEEPSLEDFIVLILIGEDYKVKAYKNQHEALKGFEEDPPDLIISDYKSPHINGLDICRILRKNLPYYYVPIIFILPDAEPLNKAKIAYAGADDYVMRESLEAELLVKVKLNLYRTGRQRDVNPITGLPEQAGLVAELEKRLEAKSLFAVFHSDLSGFRLFNQRYGFKRGDDVLKFTSSVISGALKDLGTPSDYLTHPYSDDFVFLSSYDGIDAICERIIQGFNVGIRSFYDNEDRAREEIVIKNRRGDVMRLPFMKVHIGVVTNEHYPFLGPVQIIQTSSELKDFCQKNFDKSMFVKERRKKYPFS